MAENVKRKKKKRAVLIVLMALVLAVLAVVCVYETELNKLDSNDGVDNSFYDSQFKNKKVMVIVPHEDDDLLISRSGASAYVQKRRRCPCRVRNKRR